MTYLGSLAGRMGGSIPPTTSIALIRGTKGMWKLTIRSTGEMLGIGSLAEMNSLHDEWCDMGLDEPCDFVYLG